MKSNTKLQLLVSNQEGYQIERALRFRAAGTTFLHRVPFVTASDQRKGTWSGWVKQGRYVPDQYLFSAGVNGASPRASFYIDADSRLAIGFNPTGSSWHILTTTKVFRDWSAHFHLHIAYDTTLATPSDRVKITVNGKSITSFVSGTYPAFTDTMVLGSLVPHAIGRFDLNANGYFEGMLSELCYLDGIAVPYTEFGQFNQRTGEWQAKEYKGSYGGPGSWHLQFKDNAGIRNLSTAGTATAPYGGNASAIKASDGATMTTSVTVGSAITVAHYDLGESKQISSYLLASLYFTGGACTMQMEVSNDNVNWTILGSHSVTGSAANYSKIVTAKARYARLRNVAFGTNGQVSLDAFLLYQESIGIDSSPYGNIWHPNNFSMSIDSVLDVPLGRGGLERGNYCMLNPLSNTNLTLAGLQNTNLRANMGTGAGTWFLGTLAIKSMKVFFEVTLQNNGGLGFCFGCTGGYSSNADVSNSGVFYSFPGTKRVAGADSSYGAAYTVNDVLGAAIDTINGTAEFFKNGVSQGVISAPILLSMLQFPVVWNNSSGGQGLADINFGQFPFVYPNSIPAGFKPLHTGNLLESAIPKASESFDIIGYSGDGLNARDIVTPFDVDWWWGKQRSGTAQNMINTRERSPDRGLISNSPNAESVYTGYFQMGALGTEKVTVSYAGSGGPDFGYNQAANTYVAWLWRQSILAGLQILTWNGTGAVRNLPHNLGVAPQLMLVKNLTVGSSWRVWHKNLNAGCVLYLNVPNVQTLETVAFNSAVPTSTDIVLGASGDTNGVGYEHQGFLITSVEGYSKVHTYLGNGSTEGNFVYCGFKPRWLMVKGINEISDWWIYDSYRGTFNPVNALLRASLSNAEVTQGFADFTATGFKIRNTGLNTSGQLYLYYAIADVAAKHALAF